LEVDVYEGRQGQGAAARVTAEAGVANHRESLRANAIGLPQVLFQSITSMAPASAVAFSLGAAIPFAGGSLPLAVIVALVACTFIAANIAQLAVHMPSAGGFYTYVGRSLGTRMGFLAGWIFTLGQPLIVPLQLLVIGPVVSSALTTYFHINTPWWLWALVGAALVFALTYFGVRLSTDTSVVLGVIEILIFLALAVSLIIHVGGHNTGAVFTPRYSQERGLGGWYGVLHGMIFAFLAFAGFEAAAPLAEETAEPRRNIPRAIIASAVLIGLFYVLCAYAGVLGWGLNRLGTYGADPNPWATLGQRVWGIFSLVVVFAILNSAVANTNAGVNAATRVIYAMGRAGALPAPLAAIHRAHRTPYVAILLTMTVGVVLTLWAGLVYGPTAAFGLIGTIITIVFLLLYLAACLSVIAYYRRERPDEFSVWRHILVPLIPSVILLFPLGAQFYPQPAFPYNLAGPICAAWLVLGIVVVVYLSVRHPAALANGARIFVDDPTRGE